MHLFFFTYDNKCGANFFTLTIWKTLQSLKHVFSCMPKYCQFLFHYPQISNPDMLLLGFRFPRSFFFFHKLKFKQMAQDFFSSQSVLLNGQHVLRFGFHLQHQRKSVCPCIVSSDLTLMALPLSSSYHLATFDQVDNFSGSSCHLAFLT